MKKTLTQWLNEYSATHQNPRNIRIHKVCVPLIFLSLMGILRALGKPYQLPLEIAFIVPAMIFYFSLQTRAALIMLAWSGINFLLNLGLDQSPYLMEVSVAIFVLAWIGQFIGHKIEGKKPSFFDDLKFLWVGPLWTIRKILRA